MTWALGVIYIDACQRHRESGQHVLQVIGPSVDKKDVLLHSRTPYVGAVLMRQFMPDLDATDNTWEDIDVETD